ncbi:hypothetical protein V6C03_14170 [Methyloligella sp. 2.7D]|uniref:hypothetical protein n=1 Tax=unclassified Methyloligella TaxID=2625955 RepID=UPI00157CCC9C|nr:hypothetical protein [Methyloligella sp. GL2]QKP77098.1 hypothetical protein HT051_06295 [Methyloligella sp. GL2]
MGNILQFRLREDDKPASVRGADAPRGEVVIFPGVRIERHETSKPAEQPRQRAREK